MKLLLFFLFNLFAVECAVTIHCQIRRIEIKIYDGHKYFNTSSLEPLVNAEVTSSEKKVLTDSSGSVIVGVNREKDTSLLITAYGYNQSILNLSKFKDNCEMPDVFEIFLGLPDSQYGYKDGRRVPFELRENSFAILTNESTKCAVYEYIPEEYRKYLYFISYNKDNSVQNNKVSVVPFDKDASQLNDSFFLIVDSVPEKELYRNELFGKIRDAGAELGPITKDLKMIITPSLMVQPCGDISISELKSQILNTYPQIKVEYDPTMFSNRLTLYLPKNVGLSIFDWLEKVHDLNFVARIDLNPLIIIQYN